MRDALIVGGAALVIWWLWKNQTPANPLTVDPAASMTGSGQASTIYGPGSVSEGTVTRRLYDSAAAKAAAKLYAAQPITSRTSLFRAIYAQTAKTPPAPSPIPPASMIHGTTAVTQIT